MADWKKNILDLSLVCGRMSSGQLNEPNLEKAFRPIANLAFRAE